jgi:lysozyme
MSKEAELIKSFEGLELEAYLCPANVWTIGYGHTKGVKKGDKITKEQAEKLLDEDLAFFRNGVKRLVKVALNKNQFGALVSFAYNLGLGSLESSTLLKMLNAKDYQGAADQFLRWNKSKGKVLTGLVRRREAERAVFLTPE